MPLSNPSSTLKTRSSISTTSFIYSASKTSELFLMANFDRLGATIFNNTDSDLFIDLNGSTSVTDFTARVVPGAYYEIPYNYIGTVSGVWDVAGDGQAIVKEFV